MRPKAAVIVALAGLACGCRSAASNASPCESSVSSARCDTNATPSSSVLVWSDEFDGAAGATFDHSKWTNDTGGGGFGNQEREFYTTRPENVSLDGNSHLVITALAEPASGTDQCWYGRCRYTSARLKTQGVATWMHGRIEARIRIPHGQGMWPAFWMLGADIDAAGWPACGEIDIMENIGREPGTIHGTMHGPGYSGGNGIGKPFTVSSGSFSDDFHIYAVEWRPNDVQWLVDGALYHEMTSSNIPDGTRWVFEHPFFIVLNLAVGGAWPGDPDATTALPQQMIVDYVRVYK